MLDKHAWRLVRSLLAVIVFSFLLLPFAALAGDINDVKTFDIKAQPLESALIEFSKQAGLQVISNSADIGKAQAPAVAGSKSSAKALEELLTGSGLSYRVVGPDAIAVERAKAEKEKTSDAVKQDGIVVTAQKREELLQDVPIPVTALTAGNLVDTNKTRLADFYEQVPGLNLALDNRGSPALAIRGLTTTIYGNPAVGTVIDDVPFTSSTGAEFGWAATDIDPNELQRIEVLRGPQGVLYGASSLGGLIKYVTVQPSLAGTTAHLQVSGNVVENGHGPGYGLSGSFNTPLSDTVALRASAFVRHDAGFIDNIATGQDGINAVDVSGGRLSMLWRPTNSLSLQLGALLQQSDADGSPNVDVRLDDLRQSYIRGIGGYRRALQAYNATAIANLASVNVTSITGFSHSTSKGSFDTTSVASGGSNFFLGVPFAAWMESNRTRKWSEEVRLNSSVGKLDWLVGLFYTDETTDLNGGQHAFKTAAGGEDVGVWYAGSGPVTYKEAAAFANLTYHFSDQFDVQAGARDSTNRQTFVQTTAVGPGATPVTAPELSSRENATTYLLSPSFHVTPEVMVYGRIATGFRPGGINSALRPNSAYPPTFGPDTTRNYEVGVKGDFFNRVLRLNASIYAIDWSDIQIALNDSHTNESWNENLGDARSRGVELEVTLRPQRGLTIDAWLAINEAELTKAFPATSTAVGNAGDRLPYSPKTSGRLSIDQQFQIDEAFNGFVRGSINYVGDRRGEFIGGLGSDRQTYAAYTAVDLQFGARSRDWEFQVFANNIFDKRGVLAGGQGTLDANAFTIIVPRLIGVSLKRRF